MNGNVTVLRPGLGSIKISDGRSSTDSTSFNGGNGGGGNVIEARVAKLESDVENIKTNLAEARADIRDLRTSLDKTNRDVAVILQKQIDIDDKLSKKPSLSEVQNAISSAVNKQIAWTVGTGIALLGLAKYMF
ncbi:hypothetical protein [Klebsiella pneumoniae]|uniref:hypothetical protein n=1 Tax=Klebsiella pneumoniae TaxID=573 RepID=UPI001E4F5607|nr:hypothetical protein [Klebsiella pneumoniae]